MREIKEKIRNNEITYLSDEKLIQEVIFQLDKNINNDKKKWKQLLFDVIRKWKLSNEKFSTNQINYLIGGEAFNWKTLAIRLASQSKNLSNNEEFWKWVNESDHNGDIPEKDLKDFLGYEKFRAHLSYFYGVIVEQALIASVEDSQIKKTISSGILSNKEEIKSVYNIIYGDSREHLWQIFRMEYQIDILSTSFSVSDQESFVYWLFKLRLQNSDPARIASDTKQGLIKLEEIKNSKILRNKISNHKRL
ncbi:MAG: hypothetical protein CL774_01570 [Chloroflexi bacterium]|nr:hypothetical protein [Chloroflexota bacterium]